jgi:diguanylate cyclase (GGDEF)-like protein
VKILVADDSKTNLVLITSSLEKLGHIVTPVESGQQAVDAFNMERPDLIILDVVMEGMGGFECARQIRAINSEDWIPIIFLSASVDDASIAEGIDAGGDDYLTKPFSEITLAAKIKAMQRISDMRQRLYETSMKLAHLSATDALTDLYNRFHFDRTLIEKIAAADRYKRQMALLFIDLDNFKTINDTFGHHIGDLLLKEVSKRVKYSLHVDDFVARIGGDEFAVVLSEISAPEDAGFVANRILDILTPDYYLDGHNVRIGASIGIACYPYPDTTHENLIKNADVAMYHAKELGRNNYQYFTKELNEKYKQHINLEHALRFALERNEIFLTYQPIYDLVSKRIVGLESLLCWDHPKYGLISPSIFVPMAEETGLISTIGGWVLRTACEQAKIWSLKKIVNFKLAVNLSTHQLVQENFFQNVVDILNETEIPPHLIELELTETSVMNYPSESFKGMVKKLRGLGMSIAIDDFGTGYSSLTRLKHLTIDTLKIDKVFVQDAVSNSDGAIIVNCLVALGRNLGMSVIAEGIETEEQLAFLINAGCAKGQGYFLCKPMNVEQATKFLQKMTQVI